jgi:dihydroxyacetone kinase-like protein
MPTTLTRDALAALLDGVAQDMIRDKDELTALDAELGDGDLGRTTEWGFTAIRESLASGDAASEPDMGKLLFKCGKAFADKAPSSFGALMGAAFMKGGMALKGKTEADLTDLANAVETALNALMERGGAKLGDKTMLDAMHPALLAMRAQPADALLGAFFAASAEAAQGGAVETQAMQSQIGRASWQGERSAGKMDPGARAIAMMFAAAARHST